MAKTLPTRKVSYLGVPALVKEIRQAGPSGEREVRTQWLADGQWPAGTVTSRIITGNFTRNTGQVLVDTHIVDEF